MGIEMEAARILEAGFDNPAGRETLRGERLYEAIASKFGGRQTVKGKQALRWALRWEQALCEQI